MKKTALFVVCAFVLGGLLLPHLRMSWQMPASRAEAPAADGLGVAPGPPQKALAPDEIYARAAQAAYKSVVNIDTTQRVQVRSFLDDDFFGFGGGSPRYTENLSKGSGVIISADGYILTNEHVVGGRNVAGRTIQVTMTDGRKFSGTVVGADHTSDVALVKVDGHALPAAKIGTVRGLVPGQMVVAIGNPFGLGFSVSHGVVSALDRPVAVQDRLYPKLIQHDALINPGNSGGALVGLDGQVLGINTLVSTEGQGIGFAIPIDDALKVADQLKQYGKIKRPWLGLVVSSNSPDLVAMGLPNVQGAVVRGVYPSGPAADLGLDRGDVITKVDGQRVRSEDEFKAVERKLRIGQTVPIEVMRGDTQAAGKLTVGEAP